MELLANLEQSIDAFLEIAKRLGATGSLVQTPSKTSVESVMEMELPVLLWKKFLWNKGKLVHNYDNF